MSFGRRAGEPLLGEERGGDAQHLVAAAAGASPAGVVGRAVAVAGRHRQSVPDGVVGAPCHASRARATRAASAPGGAGRRGRRPGWRLSLPGRTAAPALTGDRPRSVPPRAGRARDRRGAAAAARTGRRADPVEACGICATNLHGWAPAPAGPAALPGAHGHEVAGVVEAVGEAVGPCAPGDRVCLDPAAACGCGAATACAAGDPMRCRAQSLLPVWGFADALVVGRGRRAAPGRDRPRGGLARRAARLGGARSPAQPHGCGPRPDRRRPVLVLGAGALGLLAVAAARHLGAAEVIVVARHDTRRRWPSARCRPRARRARRRARDAVRPCGPISRSRPPAALRRR